MGKNRLNGTIPNELSLLSSIQVLHLSGAAWNLSLSGTIPSQLFTLTNLLNLHLDLNHLEQPIPVLGQLSVLKTLDFENNRLLGTIGDFGMLSNLIVLTMGNNAFEGVIPIDLNCHHLMNLQQQQTHYKGITLHHCTRVIAWLPVPAKIDVN